MSNENLTVDLSFKAEISLYYDLYVPESAADLAPLLIAVHGYGAHKRYMMREARLIAPANFVIASIQAPHPHFRQTDDGYRVGFGWLSDHRPDEHIRLHQQFVLDLIAKLSADGVIDERKIFIYGFSQACALNFRFAFTYPEILAGVIAVCGGIPGDLDTNAAYSPPSASTFYLMMTSFIHRSSSRISTGVWQSMCQIIVHSTIVPNTRSPMICGAIYGSI